MTSALDRRSFLTRAAAAGAALALGACDRLGASGSWFRHVLDKGEDATRYVQRLLLEPADLAPEFTEADIAPAFKANGSTDPVDRFYRKLVENQFADWKLVVDGLVETPLALSLADLRAMPSRTQITRHDCVEGWSCIGKWTGVPLSEVLQKAKLKPQARFVLFRCADSLGGYEPEGEDDSSADLQPKVVENKGGDAPAPKSSSDDGGIGNRYYESLALEDAYHPQTILAYDMNGAPLSVAHGAPVRVRVERQLGYKMPKYLMRIQVVDDLSGFGDGKGGFWEDRGYEWYAGI
jgi:DMSO/TMAO reductase YedYZ molybdopterin-dependent catalytic subunit